MTTDHINGSLFANADNLNIDSENRVIGRHRTIKLLRARCLMVYRPAANQRDITGAALFAFGGSRPGPAGSPPPGREPRAGAVPTRIV